MRNKPLNDEQKELVASVGLRPSDWEYTLDDCEYLHIIRKNFRNRAIIDKKKGVLIRLV